MENNGKENYGLTVIIVAAILMLMVLIGYKAAQYKYDPMAIPRNAIGKQVFCMVDHKQAYGIVTYQDENMFVISGNVVNNACLEFTGANLSYAINEGVAQKDCWVLGDSIRGAVQSYYTRNFISSKK